MNVPQDSRELFLAEIRHRLQNTFQLIVALIRLHGRMASTPEEATRLSQLAGAIAALGDLQQLLASAEPRGFAAYLASIEEGWTRVVAPRGIAIAVSAADLPVPTPAAPSLALIVHELVTNAVEHAFPDGRTGRIEITLRPAETPGHLELVVADDGVGLPDPQAAPPSGTGQTLVALLARQFDGSVTTDGASGTRVRVLIPLPAPTTA